MEILKPKKKILKNENAVNRKLGNLKNIGNLGNIIPSFVDFVFRLCPVAKIDDSNLKKLKKNFRSFRVFDLSLFRPIYLTRLGHTQAYLLDSFRNVLVNSVIFRTLPASKMLCFATTWRRTANFTKHSKEAVVRRCSLKKLFLKVSRRPEACNFIKKVL